ncbi:heterokaryon incompatibility protein-domain-containing protein [Cubamyces lactineus]|nr:heterokaryon incompatibility protein-domain-containing protein [Cubamyces lactineus]
MFAAILAALSDIPSRLPSLTIYSPVDTVCNVALPPRPRNICADAWGGVFSARLGLFLGCLDYTRDRRTNKQIRTGGYEYVVSSAELLKCAELGCAWCGLLAKHLPSVLRRSDSPDSRLHVRVGQRDSVPAGKALNLLTIIVTDGDGRETVAMFLPYTTEDDPAAPFIEGRVRIQNVGAPTVLSIAKESVEDCVRNHGRCRAITRHRVESPPLPRRLIDCSDPLRVGLVDTSRGIVPRQPYIALSYVWGPSEFQPHRTTVNNLATYLKDGIDPMDLPQTLRDAIYVTRALGVRFLWADSLCIIQDSLKDMHHELAWMRNVYRYAYLTIDAASSASAVEGFLQQRRPLDPENVIPFLCPPSSSGEVKIGQLYLRELESRDPQPADIVTRGADAFDQSHTSKRAWCLQEMLLSTRCLVFTSETLQLRCHSQTENIGGASHDAKGDLPRLPDASFHPDLLVERGSDRWRTTWQTWYDIVGNYSRRSLTNPSDKLIALSGLAELFARALGSDYLAGLWRIALPGDLLWQVRVPPGVTIPPGTSNSSRPRGYRAPSWSWASVDGPISQPLHYNFDQGYGKCIVEVVGCTVSLQNKVLPFGPVVGGSLVLRTMLLRVRHRSASKGGFLRLTIVTAFEPMQRTQRGHKTPGAEFSVDIHFDCDADNDDIHPLWIIPVWRGSYWVEVGFEGLLVTRADPADWPSAGAVGSRDVYRRVGFCTCMLVKLRGTSSSADLFMAAPRVEVVLV